MNAMVKNISLAGNKFMLEMHLKQPGFTYSTCGPFNKNNKKRKNKKFKRIGDPRYIYQNKQDKACFHHHMA